MGCFTSATYNITTQCSYYAHNQVVLIDYLYVTVVAHTSLYIVTLNQNEGMSIIL